MAQIGEGPRSAKLPALAPAAIKPRSANLSNIGPGDELTGGLVKSASGSTAPTKHRRRAGVNVQGACGACRAGKRKCDGGRPQCGACAKRGNTCVYEQVDGMSRAQTIKLNLDSANRDKKALLNLLNSFVSNTTSEVAVQELAKQLQGTSDMPSALREEIKQSIENRDRSPVSNSLSPAYRIDSSASMASSYPSIEAEEYGRSYLEEDSATETFDVDVLSTRYSSGLILDNKPDTLLSASSVTSSSSPALRRQSQAQSPELLRRGNVNAKQQQRDDTHALRLVGERLTAASIPLFGSEASPGTAKPSDCLQIYAHLPLTSGHTGGSTIGESQVLDCNIPIHSIMPLWIESDSPFSQTVTRFIKLARERIEKGWNVEDILGTNDVDLDALFRHHSSAYNPLQEEFCVNSWAINVLRALGEKSQEHCICGYIALSRIAKWLISPCAETYAAIPNDSKPRPVSRFVPHPAEFTFIAFPEIADTLILNPRDEWHQTMKNNLRLAWPKADSGIKMSYRHPETGATMLSKEGEAYITTASNWIMNTSELYAAFPQLRSRAGGEQVDRSAAAGPRTNVDIRCSV